MEVKMEVEMEVENSIENNSKEVSVEEEYEEIEYIIYLEFEPYIEKEQVEPDDSLKILGLDTEEPVVILNECLFEGIHTTAIGTYMFFEYDLNRAKYNPPFEQTFRKYLRMYMKTNKLIRLEQAYIRHKADLLKEKNKKKLSRRALKEKIKPPMKYHEALRLLLPPGSEPLEGYEMDYSFSESSSDDDDDDSDDVIDDSEEDSDNSNK